MPIGIRPLDPKGPPVSWRACANLERQHPTLQNAGNPEDNRASGGRVLARKSQVCGWTEGGPTNRGLRLRLPRTREWQMRPFGGSLLHLGEIPEPRRHLPIAHREQDLDSQLVKRGSSTPQLEWGQIEMGQSHPEGKA